MGHSVSGSACECYSLQNNRGYQPLTRATDHTIRKVVEWCAWFSIAKYVFPVGSLCHALISYMGRSSGSPSNWPTLRHYPLDAIPPVSKTTCSIHREVEWGNVWCIVDLGVALLVIRIARHDGTEPLIWDFNGSCGVGRWGSNFWSVHSAAGRSIQLTFVLSNDAKWPTHSRCCSYPDVVCILYIDHPRMMTQRRSPC